MWWKAVLTVFCPCWWEQAGCHLWREQREIKVIPCPSSRKGSGTPCVTGGSFIEGKQGSTSRGTGPSLRLQCFYTVAASLAVLTRVDITDPIWMFVLRRCRGSPPRSCLWIGWDQRAPNGAVCRRLNRLLFMAELTSEHRYPPKVSALSIYVPEIAHRSCLSRHKVG